MRSIPLQSATTYKTTVEDIYNAFSNGEFVLYYQPIVNLRSGKILGVEALIRWRSPQFGLLSPHYFLPLIIGSPLEFEINLWAMRTALAECEHWKRIGLTFSINVNISPRQLSSRSFVDMLSNCLSEFPSIPPSLIELEIVESSSLQNIEEVSDVVRNCRKLGVSFALDDFGTGYSSLQHLRALSINSLKIDRSFVSGLSRNSTDRILVQGVLYLANKLHLHAKAEGVETAEQKDALLSLGCEIAQGYWISEPLSRLDLLDWALSSGEKKGSDLFLSSLASPSLPSAPPVARHASYLPSNQHKARAR
jgi:EAL domain-containing protein (putative c-di-GMP-specific phosphodiesterase class I)